MHQCRYGESKLMTSTKRWNLSNTAEASSDHRRHHYETNKAALTKGWARESHHLRQTNLRWSRRNLSWLQLRTKPWHRKWGEWSHCQHQWWMRNCHCTTHKWCYYASTSTGKETISNRKGDVALANCFVHTNNADKKTGHRWCAKIWSPHPGNLSSHHLQTNQPPVKLQPTYDGCDTNHKATIEIVNVLSPTAGKVNICIRTAFLPASFAETTPTKEVGCQTPTNSRWAKTLLNTNKQSCTSHNSAQQKGGQNIPLLPS